MASSMEWTPRPASKAGFAAKIDVCRYDPDGAPGKRYEILPNIQCDQIQYREGAEPPTARFRYVLDDRARAMGWPSQFETILRLHDKVSPEGDQPERAERYVVKTDDRIVVLASDPTDSKSPPSILFDGFAQSPQADVSGKGQQVTFVAVGVAARCWDTPIIERKDRDADEPDSDDDDHNHVNFGRVIFNPSGPKRRSNLDTVKSTAGNATADNADEPAFVDPRYGDPNATDGPPAAWTLDRAARYLLQFHNDGEFVENPDLDILRDLLRCRKPKDEEGYYNPSDDSTYDEEPILLMEYDATGKPWPEALGSLLEHYGFAMAFRCENDGGNEPWNWLEIYRKDGAGPFEPKTIPFQAAGSGLDPARQAIGSMAITRDYQSAFNVVAAITRPTLYEASFVLAPLAENEGQVEELNGKYRVWVAAEFPDEIIPLDAGRRYRIADKKAAKPIDFTKLWWNPDVKRPRRRYPGRAELISRDKNGGPVKAILAVSHNYDGPINAIVDPEKVDDFRPVAPGHGWKLLEDRLGVVLTAPDMDKWNIGIPEGKKSPETITWMQKMFFDPDAEGGEIVCLLLTVVIEDEPGISFVASARSASPLKHERTRVIDVGDSREELIHFSSAALATFDLDQYNGKPNRGVDVEANRGVMVYRSDQAAIEDHLKQIQLANENPPIAGTITIPWISEAYQVGDQIAGIAGRGLSLCVNAGAEQGEAKRYPYVVGVDWGFANGQSTTLHLSDRRAEPIGRF